MLFFMLWINHVWKPFTAARTIVDGCVYGDMSHRRSHCEIQQRLVMEWYISGLFVSNTDLTFGREDWNKPEGAQLHTEVFKLVWGEI